jgi:hypothetical protein
MDGQDGGVRQHTVPDCAKLQILTIVLGDERISSTT